MGKRFAALTGLLNDAVLAAVGGKDYPALTCGHMLDAYLLIAWLAEFDTEGTVGGGANVESCWLSLLWGCLDCASA